MNTLSMIYNKVKGNLLLPITCSLLPIITGCQSSIDLPSVDESRYQLPGYNSASLIDKYGATCADSLVFNGQGSINLYVNTTEVHSSSLAAPCLYFSLKYDTNVLDRYNAAHSTSYKPLPENLVTIGKETEILDGEKTSKPVNVAYTTADELDANGVYAIPLKLEGDAATDNDQSEFVLLVRDITKMPDCHKDNGMQVISCMEVNDANPLFNLCFTLENSGKYLFDQVILFSGNINYNEETHEVYNYNNDNMTHVLQYKEKYIEPLQQKGMKVIFGILGNHDRSGIASLSDEGAKAFAQELKSTLDAYGLDGLFFDDEYSSYGDYPGFLSPSYAAASRLIYECKQAMPSKLMEAYVYGYTRKLVEVDGKQPGEYIDYVIQDYGNYGNLSTNYPGLDKSRMIQASAELYNNRSSSATTYKKILTEGYGGTMVFSLATSRPRLNVLSKISQALYGESVIQNGSIDKDW